MSTGNVILITLIVYQLALLGMGWWAQRRTHDAADYFLGNRQLGPFVASISYAASSSSAWSLLGVSGAAFTLGLGAVWLMPGIVSCHLIAWFVIAPRLRRLAANRQHLTMTDVLADHASPHGRRVIVITASTIILFCFMFYVASQFQGAGNTFAASFDIDRSLSIWLGGIVVLIYTVLGGFWAVSLTDAMQGVLMALAAIALPVMALIAVGGPAELMAGLDSVNSAAQNSWTQGHVGLLGLGFVLGMAMIGLGAFGQPHLLNRFMALRDETALKQARVMAIGWFTIVLSGMLVTGWCGHVLLPDAIDSETLFFTMTADLFPALIGAVITAAVLSAIMSTADSQLLVAASTIAHDLRRSGSQRSHAHALGISRLTIVLLCLASILIAIYLPASIFDRVLFAWNGLGAAFGPLIFGHIAGRQIPARTTVLAMLCGFGLTALIYSLTSISEALSWLPESVQSVLVSIAQSPGDIAERALPFALAALIVWFGSKRSALII